MLRRTGNKKMINNRYKAAIIVSLQFLLTQAIATESYTPNGFGKNMDLKDALDIIVPVEWNIFIARGSLEEKVSWNGGEDWKMVVADLADEANLEIELNSKKKEISIKSKSKAPISIQKTPVQKIISQPVIEPKDDVRYAPIAEIIPVVEEPEVRMPRLNSTISVNNTEITPTPVTKKKKSFMESLKSEVVGIFSSNSSEKKEKQIENTIDEKNLLNLFSNLNMAVNEISAIKTISIRDNTVKFSFTIKTNNDTIESYLVFNGISSFSPIFKRDSKLIIMNWYNENYTHPAPALLEPIRPLSSTYTGEYDKKIGKPKVENIYFSDAPSYIQQKKYTIKEGEMLSDAIDDWASIAGVSVIWKSDADFKITKEITFYDGFLQSIDSIIKFYNNTKSPLQTRFFIKNKTLLVENLGIIYREK